MSSFMKKSSILALVLAAADGVNAVSLTSNYRSHKPTRRGGSNKHNKNMQAGSQPYVAPHLRTKSSQSSRRPLADLPPNARTVPSPRHEEQQLSGNFDPNHPSTYSRVRLPNAVGELNQHGTGFGQGFGNGTFEGFPTPPHVLRAQQAEYEKGFAATYGNLPNLAATFGMKAVEQEALAQQNPTGVLGQIKQGVIRRKQEEERLQREEDARRQRAAEEERKRKEQEAERLRKEEEERQQQEKYKLEIQEKQRKLQQLKYKRQHILMLQQQQQQLQQQQQYQYGGYYPQQNGYMMPPPQQVLSQVQNGYEMPQQQQQQIVPQVQTGHEMPQQQPIYRTTSPTSVAGALADSTNQQPPMLMNKASYPGKQAATPLFFSSSRVW